MANESIVEKLNQHIAHGLTREADITYLLVQLGKLIERKYRKTKYPVLRFYRNWAVHERLAWVDANPTMREILDDFEVVLELKEGGADITEAVVALTQGVSLARLEGEIDQTFDDFQGFDRSRVQRADQWSQFRSLLLSILSDISLEADTTYRLLAKLHVAGTNTRFETIVITDRQGSTFSVPLTS